MSSLLRARDAARLALHACSLLAREPGTRCSAGSLARELSSSVAHLAKVLQRLEQVGLVTGVRGPAGGYCLARSAQEITLAEVYEAVVGRLDDGSCPFGIPACDGQGCELGPYLASMNRKIANRLRRTTLAGVKLRLKGAR